MKCRHLLWVLCFAAVLPVRADSVATQTLVITILPIVGLSVPPTGAMTLEMATAGQAERYQPVQLVQRAGLRVCHNLPGSRTVQAEAIMGGAPNDIDLTCATTDRAGVTLIRGGMGQGTQTITGAVGFGFHDFDLLWQAGATGPGTTPGDYRCDIRFTLASTSE